MTHNALSEFRDQNVITMRQPSESIEFLTQNMKPILVKQTFV